MKKTSILLNQHLMWSFLLSMMVSSANAQTTTKPKSAPPLSMYIDGLPVQDGVEVLLIGWKDYTFRCEHSESDAGISWKLGAIDVTSSGTKDNSLTLTNVALECGLKLSCSAGNMSVAVTIRIITPPREVKLLLDDGKTNTSIEHGKRARLSQGESYKFHCQVDGVIPEADFHWSIMERVDKVTLAESDATPCSLTCSEDSYVLSADYDTHQDVVLECRASNDANPIGVVHDVILDVTVPPESAYLSKDDEQINTKKVRIINGTLATITCTANNARPAAVIDWFLDGDNITDIANEEVGSHEDNVLLDTTSILELTFTSGYCNKELQCVVKHPKTDTELTKSVTFDILVPPTKPTISLADSSKVFTDNEHVTLTHNHTYSFDCSTPGAIPAANFQWKLGENNKTNYTSANNETNCISHVGRFQYNVTVNHTLHHKEALECIVSNAAQPKGVSTHIDLVVNALFGFQTTKLPVLESDSEVTVTLYRTGPYDAKTSAQLSVDASSTATLGKDFRSSSFLPATIEFAAGQATRSVVFYIEDDNEFELDESFTLNIDMPVNGKIISGKNKMVISIQDSEDIVFSCSAEDLDKYTRCKDLEAFSKINVTHDNVEAVAHTLADLTAQILPSRTTSADALAVAITIENIAKVKSSSKEVTSSCIETVDYVSIGLQPKPDSNPNPHSRNRAYDSNIANATKRIVQSLETQATHTLRKYNSTRIIRPNIAVVGLRNRTIAEGRGIGMMVLKSKGDAELTSLPPGVNGTISLTAEQQVQQNVTNNSSRNNIVQFSDETVSVIYDVTQMSDTERIGTVFIPTDFIGLPATVETKNPMEAEIIFFCYSTPVLFPNKNWDEFIDSIVMSANVVLPNRNNTSTSTKTVTTTTTEPRTTTGVKKSPTNVTVEVVTSKQIAKQDLNRCDEYGQPLLHECVFWNFELNEGKGAWSSAGCKKNLTKDNRVTCHCDHMTHFAVLARYKKASFFLLDWISEIGCYATIGCVGFTLIIFTVLKKPRKVCVSKAPRQVFYQFCLSLLLLTITFLVTIGRKCPLIYCEVGAILMHYFMLSSMMWMGVQMRYLYHKLASELYMDYMWLTPLATIICWGVPLIPVIPTIVLNYDSYQNEHYCFLVPGYTLYYGLILPIGLILLHNLISFIVITNRLRKNTIPNLEEPERVDFKRQFQDGFLMSILMLLTWVSAYLILDVDVSSDLIISVIFCISNGLQGICVFWFCIRQTDVYKCAKCCDCKVKRRESFGGKWTPGSMSRHKNDSYLPD